MKDASGLSAAYDNPSNVQFVRQRGEIPGSAWGDSFAECLSKVHGELSSAMGKAVSDFEVFDPVSGGFVSLRRLSPSWAETSEAALTGFAVEDSVEVLPMPPSSGIGKTVGNRVPVVVLLRPEGTLLMSEVHLNPLGSSAPLLKDLNFKSATVLDLAQRMRNPAKLVELLLAVLDERASLTKAEIQTLEQKMDELAKLRKTVDATAVLQRLACS